MEFIIKSHDISQRGVYPGSRPVEELLKNGLIILDKWPGPTSHDVAATIRKTLGVKKAGHAGTLDPKVTGVLPVTLDNACKVMPALQKLDKEYVGIMKLHKDVDKKVLENKVKKFTGKIKQMPPLRSAVARRERERKVHSFEIIEISGREVLFRISCEAGTYVRVVCHDIGKEIGGANMAELRRVRTGRFDKPVRMEDVANAYENWKKSGDESIREYVLPVEEAIEHLPKIIIKDSAVFSVANGSPVYTPGISRYTGNMKKDDLTAVLTLRGELVALAKADMSAAEIKRKKGIAAKTDRVVINKEIYK